MASTCTSYDARELDRDSFGGFDAVASLGAFEHFCSPEEYRAGRQEDVYRAIFEHVATVLPARRALLSADDGLRREHDPDRARSTSAPRDSDAFVLALMERQFPGSWLPFGHEQVVRCAEPSFG